jgi:hypothetical protein
MGMPEYPPLPDVQKHALAVAAALRAAGVHSKTVAAIRTKALQTAKKVGGQFATNREKRWLEDPGHPQYDSEYDCYVIFVKLCAQVFCFQNAPLVPQNLRFVPKDVRALGPTLRHVLEERYLGQAIEPNTFKDSLLLERFDFNDLVSEGLNPVHGYSSFHIGHEDPTKHPKHIPANVQWRTYRSNMIQGNMTLPQARLYFVKLIARYFELGEIQIVGEAPPEAIDSRENVDEEGSPID